MSNVRTAKEQFDQQAAHYDAQWNQWSQENLRWMVEHSRHTGQDRLLDIATGAGFTALAFAPFVREVIGVDVSTGMLAQARSHAEEQGVFNVRFQEAAAEHLPFEADSFDIVSCRIAAHHFLSITDFLNESYRVLKPGGRLVLSDTTVPDDDPNAAVWQNEVEKIRDTSHVRNLTPNEWRIALQQAGFDVVELTSQGEGITISFADWVRKAGCTPEQAEEVRRHFADAPDSAIRQFHIQYNAEGVESFTWQHVVAFALKPLK